MDIQPDERTLDGLDVAPDDTELMEYARANAGTSRDRRRVPEVRRTEPDAYPSLHLAMRR